MWVGSLRLLLMLLGLAVPAVPATAQTILMGSAAPILNRGSGTWCSMEAGATLFQRNGTGPAQISLPQLTFANMNVNPQQYWALEGRTYLAFSTSTSGVAYFNFVDHYPAGVGRPSFTDYSQVFNANANSLVVSFRLAFPGCTVPVTLIYIAG
jgi:hypothetical protein